ncbi:di-N-acetylchitobiase-like [Asterias rubens]|uniref:di-N-acetylchitobiase-like n=1 Tax=Asterias rubens TaxID=7604 RepID=UPI0014553C7B|nr:di-N-acetylchitobiase-like [Asterias rubens]
MAVSCCNSLTMYSYSTVLLLSVLIAVFTGSNCCMHKADPCPCKDQTLCNFITKTPQKELFVFQVSDVNWMEYDWSYITTLVNFAAYNPDEMCYAHSKGARYIRAVGYPLNELSNVTYRSVWVKQQVELATKQYTDGINIDFEKPLSRSRSEMLTALVNETAQAFRAANPHAQITIDVPHAPCGYGRCYDYVKLASICDFLVIMDYDMVGPSHDAHSNDGINYVKQGWEAFLKEGIPASKLVTAVPWYGYDFPCTHLLKDNICSYNAPQDENGIVTANDVMTKRGVQKYGSRVQVVYKRITQLLKNSTTGRIFNETYGSPFFNHLVSGHIHQLWYDDPESLTLRYNNAKSFQLRGVSMWQADCLDYSDDPEAKALTKAMWDAIKTFFM